MKVAIVGAREFTDYGAFKEILDEHLQLDKVERIVSGGANGTDSMAERYAKENCLPMLVFPANWDKYGRSAGVLRNKQIVEDADIVVAFLKGESKGTKHSIKLAKEAKKRVVIFNMDEED